VVDYGKKDTETNRKRRTNLSAYHADFTSLSKTSTVIYINTLYHLRQIKFSLFSPFIYFDLAISTALFTAGSIFLKLRPIPEKSRNFL